MTYSSNAPKKDATREQDQAIVEIWDESGSLIGVIEPNKQGNPQAFPEWRNKHQRQHKE